MKATPLQKQTVFLTLGYPGAGKSFTSRQLSESLNIPRISADRIRYDLFDSPQYSRDEDAIVFRVFDYMLEEFLKAGHSVVCDGDFSLRKSRRLKAEMAHQHGASTVILWIQTDLETAFDRASNRDGRRIDDKFNVSIDRDIFTSLTQKMKKPEKENTIVMSGKHAYKVQLDNIVRKLKANGYIATEQPAARPAQANRIVQRNRAPLRVDPIKRQ